MYEAGRYKNALNRAYYSIFHAMRAVNALDGFDISKHSGVIAHFNQNYVIEYQVLGVPYIPIAKARDFTAHLVKRSVRDSWLFRNVLTLMYVVLFYLINLVS